MAASSPLLGRRFLVALASAALLLTAGSCEGPGLEPPGGGARGQTDDGDLHGGGDASVPNAGGSGMTGGFGNAGAGGTGSGAAGGPTVPPVGVGGNSGSPASGTGGTGGEMLPADDADAGVEP